MSVPHAVPRVLDRLRIGSAPDSWGVWFPDDDQQVPWRRFLDEVAEAQYEWIELGPYGYLPTDPAVLHAELGERDLKVSAGTIFTSLHHGPDVWDKTWAHVSEVATLTRAMNAKHLVVIPSFWRDDKTAEELEPRELTTEQWHHLNSGMERLGKQVREEFGLDIVVHPHADTHIDTEEHVERFLDGTDALWSTCAWTPGTTRTAAATTSSSSRPTANGSATSTSSRSTRTSSPTSSRRARPSGPRSGRA